MRSIRGYVLTSLWPGPCRPTRGLPRRRSVFRDVRVTAILSLFWASESLIGRLIGSLIHKVCYHFIRDMTFLKQSICVHTHPRSEPAWLVWHPQDERQCRWMEDVGKNSHSIWTKHISKQDNLSLGFFASKTPGSILFIFTVTYPALCAFFGEISRLVLKEV